MAAAATMTPKNFHDSIRSLWQGSGNAATSTTSVSSYVEKQANSAETLVEEQRQSNKEIIALLTAQVKMLKKGGIGGDGGIGLGELLMARYLPGFFGKLFGKLGAATGITALLAKGKNLAGVLARGTINIAKQGIGNVVKIVGAAGTAAFAAVASLGRSLLSPVAGIKNLLTSSGVFKQIASWAPKLKMMPKLLGKLFWPITALMGLIDGFSGWGNAEKILGKVDVTFTDKLIAAVGSIVNGLLFGIPDWLVRQFGGNNLASIMAQAKDGVAWFGEKVGIFTKNVFYEIGKRIPGVSSLIERIEREGGIGNLIYNLFDNVRIALWDGIKYIGTALKDMIVETIDNIRKNFRNWLFGGSVPDFFTNAIEADGARNAGAAIGASAGKGIITPTSSIDTTPTPAAESKGMWDNLTDWWSGKEKTETPTVKPTGGSILERENAKIGDAVRVVSAGTGQPTVIEDANGKVVSREGARNWRNNNPGNIEYGDFANAQGAIGSDGRFAIFPSYEAGRKAKENLFFEGKNYKDKNLYDAVARYAPPSENNTLGYAQAIASATGTSLDTPLSSFTPEQRIQAMDAMQKVEGFKVGKETVLNPGREVSTVSLPTKAQVAEGHYDTAGRGNWEGVDPRLKHLYEETSKEFPLRNRMMSGQHGRASGEHARGNAFDLTLYDQAGTPLPSYQDGTAFRAYELFAQTMHKKAQELYPELVDGKSGEQLDWGGLFGGGNPGDKGYATPSNLNGIGVKYGSADLMDFRITRGDKTKAGNIMDGLQGQYKGSYDNRDALGGSKPYSEDAYNNDMAKLHDFVLTDEQKRNAAYFGVARNSPFLGPNKARTMPESTIATGDIKSDTTASTVSHETPNFGKVKQVSPAFDQALDATVLNKPRVPDYSSVMQPITRQENPLTGASGSGTDGSYKVSEVPSMDEMKMLLINGSSIT